MSDKTQKWATGTVSVSHILGIMGTSLSIFFGVSGQSRSSSRACNCGVGDKLSDEGALGGVSSVVEELVHT